MATSKGTLSCGLAFRHAVDELREQPHPSAREITEATDLACSGRTMPAAESTPEVNHVSLILHGGEQNLRGTICRHDTLLFQTSARLVLQISTTRERQTVNPKGCVASFHTKRNLNVVQPGRVYQEVRRQSVPALTEPSLVVSLVGEAPLE